MQIYIDITPPAGIISMCTQTFITCQIRAHREIHCLSYICWHATRQQSCGVLGCSKSTAEDFVSRISLPDEKVVREWLCRALLQSLQIQGFTAKMKCSRRLFCDATMLNDEVTVAGAVVVRTRQNLEALLRGIAAAYTEYTSCHKLLPTGLLH